MTTRAVILNDSNPDGVHFGCMRVMRAIQSGLTSRDVEVLASIPHATDWLRIPSLLDVVRKADLIVINGEGTLHHGSRKARWLLEAVEVARETGARTALVNALWQQNPPEFGALAARLDYIFCRDSRSAEDLSRAVGRQVPWFGDLSLYAEVPQPSTNRTPSILLGDSVHSSVTRKIATLSKPLMNQGHTVRIVPVVSQLRQISPALGAVRRTLRSAYVRLRQQQFVRQFPETRFVGSDDAYLSELQACGLSITGRFHAACLAVLTETPFIAISSNSWKIESLIKDIGLSEDRVIPVDQLHHDLVGKRDWSFTSNELTRLRDFLARTRISTDLMWDEIVGGSRNG